MIKVSIIVPVYNLVNYLSACVDSILKQTFSEFELILIDDGSTDGTSELCDRYLELDERITVIHKENAGVSSARNCGLDRAAGEFIVFIDADDYVSEDYIEALMKEQTYDYVTGGYHMQFNSEKWGDILYIDKTVDILEFRKKPSYYLSRCDVWSPWGKRFRRSTIEQLNLRFDTQVDKGEDVIFNFRYLALVSSIRILPILGYYYSFREESLVRRFHEDFWKWTIQMAEAQQQFYGVLDKAEQEYMDGHFLHEIVNLMKTYSQYVGNEVDYLEMLQHPFVTELFYRKKKTGNIRERIYIFLLEKDQPVKAAFFAKYTFQFWMKVKRVLIRVMRKMVGKGNG